MPFMGQDWRSPGEAWVKTETLGWQRMKIIESQLYPACHQSPACSWPPGADYGQHMDNHCQVGGRRDDDTAERRLETGKPATRTGSLSSSDATSPASSADSSRANSLSPSPSSSPEKSAHHIHPIAISSPYGWHSCSAQHPAALATNCCANDRHRSTMSKSLSKESLVSASNNLETRNSIMRYNRSISDFRNDSNYSNQEKIPAVQTDTDRKQRTSDDGSGCAHPNLPALMRNGQTIGPDDSNGQPVVGGERERSFSETTIPGPGTRQNRQIRCCCCCSATGSGVALGSSSPCQFYPLKGPSESKTAPHCRISVRTREVAMYNTISEAFYRLDFCNAIHDIRRFNYICKLLHLLITQNLTSLSGCATRVLFSMLEQVAWEVSNNKRNIHILKNLLKELRQMIERYYCWGRPIGSSLLWRQHFETIERISQIVDGIELAPQKADANQASFNDLPVEMIREILLRLNDYRDLVNSAQASPVMQIMIDNQYIWQNLCKYHFTEQQLKLALENGCNYRQLTSPSKQRTNKVQGVKYARTASADGRSSYRNPVNPIDSVASKPKKKEPQPSASSSNLINASDKSAGHRQKSPSSSYVTKAIRIFDREGSSATLGRVNESKSSKQPRQTTDSSQRRTSQSANTGPKVGLKSSQQQASNANTLRTPSSQEIDWERVFHQLRKKFDLKEEYPDCLLLCRHCRCLFWKSFGHPCIKTDNIRLDAGHLESGSNNVCSNPTAPNNEITGQESVRSRSDSSPARADSVASGASTSRGSRPSVADLSRTFSGERVAAPNSGFSNIENIRPPRQTSQGNSGSNYGGSNWPPVAANSDATQSLRVHHPRMNAQGVLRAAGNNNNNLASQRTSSSNKRDELIPKHVAITPQAFLKFFSL